VASSPIKKTAEMWWNQYFYDTNGFDLWKASGIFTYLSDEYYEWSMKCLRRTAWRQHPIEKDVRRDEKASVQVC